MLKFSWDTWDLGCLRLIWKFAEHKCLIWLFPPLCKVGLKSWCSLKKQIQTTSVISPVRMLWDNYCCYLSEVSVGTRPGTAATDHIMPSGGGESVLLYQPPNHHHHNTPHPPVFYNFLYLICFHSSFISWFFRNKIEKQIV